MIKKYFEPSAQTNLASLSLLILRLVVGIAFLYHGWGKIQSPANWLPTNAPVQIPALFQFLAALSEFGGGIAFILGLITPLAAIGVSITMAVATYMHMILFQDPFVHPAGGLSYESALGYFAIALVLLFVGPGKFSLDYLIFKERR